MQAVATSDKIDLDALLAALAKPPARLPPRAGRRAAGSDRQAGRQRPAHSGHADPVRSAATCRCRCEVERRATGRGGAIYRAIATHIDLHGGRLRLDPLSADLPEGHLDAALSADATQAAPAVALRLQIPALALQPLLAAMRMPGVITGNLQVQADLRGSGRDAARDRGQPRRFAGPRDGQWHRGQPPPRQHARIDPAPGQSARPGRPRRHQPDPMLRRAARRRHGIATVRSLVLASSLLTMDGSGSLNLGAETLDLRVRPQAQGCRHRSRRAAARSAGRSDRRPPRPTPTAAVTENAGTVAGAVLGNTTPLGLVAGALGGAATVRRRRRSIAARPSRVARGTPGAAGRPPPRLRSPHRNSSQSRRTSAAC